MAGKDDPDRDLQGARRRALRRRTNLDGDRQADLRVHGGPDKAVYAYPSAYYELWSRAARAPCPPRGVGENLTTDGLVDDDVSVGDCFRIGTAELVVTQPRLPCFKLGIKMRRDEFVLEFLERGLLGFLLGRRPRRRSRGRRPNRRAQCATRAAFASPRSTPLCGRPRRRRDATCRRARRFLLARLLSAGESTLWPHDAV